MREELELRSGSHTPNSPERAPAPTLLSWPRPTPLPVAQITQIEASAHICPCLPSLQASLLWSPLSLAFPLPPVSQTRLHPQRANFPTGMGGEHVPLDPCLRAIAQAACFPSMALPTALPPSSRE